MANVIEILINAKNNASAEIDKATGGLGKFATAAGVGAAAGAMAGQVIQRAMQEVQNVVVNNTVAMAAYAESLKRVGEDTGLTTKQLQVYRREIERNGLSVDSLEQSLRLFNQQLAAGTLAKYGVTSRDTATALEQLSRAYLFASDTASRAAIAGDALGARNARLASSVIAVASAYSDKYNEAVSSGYVMSDRLEGSLGKLDTSLDDFGDTMQAFKNAAAGAFNGPLKGAVDFLNAINQINQAFEKMKQNAESRLLEQLTPASMMPAHGAGGWSGGMMSAHGNPLVGGGGGKPAPAVVDPLVAKLDELVKAFTQVGGGGPLSALRGAMAGGVGAGADGKSMSDPVVKAFSRVQEAAVQFGSNFQGSLTSTLTQALSITTTSTNMIVMAFTSLANALTATIAEMMARAAAAGLVKLALSFLPGGGAVSAGAKIGATFAASSRMGGGGNTYVIQSISARDAMDDLLNPTGSLRRANDRVRDISIAAMG